MPEAVEGVEQLRRLSAALKDADRPLRNQIRKGLREIGKPVGVEVIQEAAKEMPHRGGFADLVANARPGLRFSGSQNPTIALLLKDKSNHDLKSLDAGTLRHPVFGHRDTWVAQHVPDGAFTRAFESKSPRVRAAMIRAVDEALNRIAHES